jgi:hypothetical protein
VGATGCQILILPYDMNSVIQCPSWAILSLDHMGREKKPRCIGSANSESLKPICEDCELGCYSVLVANGITDEHSSIIVRRCG